MNRTELVVAANRLGIRRETYSLDGGLPDECYVLAIENGGWSVYFVERGRRTGGERFDTEDEACDWLLMKLTRDEATRIDYPRHPYPA